MWSGWSHVNSLGDVRFRGRDGNTWRKAGGILQSRWHWDSGGSPWCCWQVKTFIHINMPWAKKNKLWFQIQGPNPHTGLEPLKHRHWCAAGGYMRSRRSKWVLWTLAACGNQFVLNTRHLASCHISRFSVSAHFPLMMSSGKCKKNIRAGKSGRMIILSWLLKIFRKHLPSSAQCSLCRIHHDQPSIAARSYKGAESWPH